MKITGIGQEKIHDYDDERSVTIQTQNNPPTIVGGRLATTRTGAIFCHKTREYSPVCEATEANINDPQGHRTNVGTTSYAYVCDPIKRLTTTTMNTATSAYVYDASHRHFVMTVNRSVVQALAVVVHVGGSADAKWLQGMQRCSVAELTGSVGGEWYVDELLATQTSASNNDISGYTLCANEGQAFALPSTCDVAYGAKGAFVFRSAQSGTITFNNATFGDPAPGAPKKGYYRLSGGQRFYAHANHLYSVAAITNAAGSVVERYRYDTYGNRTTLAPDGITTRAVSSYNQQVGFTGRYLDKETGLWYFRARYFSGTLGRFIGRDPLGYVDGMGLYSAYFVPTNLDPTGNKIEFEPDTIEAHPWRSDNAINRVQITKPNGSIEVTYTVGDTRNLIHLNQAKCYCVTCSNHAKQKCQIECSVDYRFIITLYPDTIALSVKEGAKAQTIAEVYQHEKMHVEAQVKELRDYLVTVAPRTKTCTGSEQACTVASKTLQDEINKKITDIGSSASAHSANHQSNGGPAAGTPYPLVGQMPAASKTGYWVGQLQKEEL